MLLKCVFLKKSFIMNAPLVSCPFPVITLGWVRQQTHPKGMTGNGQLTKGAFIIISDCLRNPHFSYKTGRKIRPKTTQKPEMCDRGAKNLDTKSTDSLDVIAKGQLILKFLFGLSKSSKKPKEFFSRISALSSKKRSNQKIKGTLYH